MTEETPAARTRKPFRRACRWCFYAWGSIALGFLLPHFHFRGIYGDFAIVLLFAGTLFSCIAFVFSTMGLLFPGDTRRLFFLIPAAVSGIPAGFILLFLLPARHMAPRLETLRNENPYRRSPAIFYFSRQSPPSPAVLSALVGVLSAKNLSDEEWSEIAKCVAKYGGLAEKAALLRSLHTGLREYYAYGLSGIVSSYDVEFDVAMRGAFRTATEAGKEGIVQLYAKWGDQGVDGLCALLRPNSTDRETLLKALGATRSRRAIPVLEKHLDAFPWTVTRALVVIGPPAAGVLKSHTSGEYPTGTRAACAWGYGQVSGPDGVGHLRELLSDSDPGVVSYALLGLGFTGSDAANQLLLEHFPQTKGTARTCVVESLGRLGRKESIPALRQAMDDPGFWVRNAAVWALMHVGGPAATESVIKGLADANPKVVESAAWCAGHLAAQEAVPSLVRLVEESTDKYTRRAVAFALSNIAQNAKTDPQVRATCRQALLILSKDTWSEVRAHAAKGLKDPR